MSLRRKLLTTFGGLAAMTLVVAGITAWATLQWRSSEAELQDHYGRSLQLQNVRATIFRAFKEVSDAVNGGDLEARQEFRQALAPADESFARWTELADSDAEREEVERIRAAFDQIVLDSERVFDLVDAGERDAAFALLEGDLEDNDFWVFGQLSEQAVASDQELREVIRARTENARETAQIVLALAAFGVISLVLLLFAYLASDLFAPLREIVAALEDVGRGNLGRRIAQDRADELGLVAVAFNQMADTLEQREHGIALDVGKDEAHEQWRTTPSRQTLHRLLGSLRGRVLELDHHSPDGRQQQVVADIDLLTQHITQIAEYGFPLDIRLVKTDVRALLYEMTLRFHDEFIDRTVSLELHIAPDVRDAMIDRLKIREALGELIKNALAALPEEGGSIGIRATLVDERATLVLEVADDGRGTTAHLTPRSFDDEPRPQRKRGGGLDITRAIVQQHGGTFTIDSRPKEGTVIEMRLPVHA